jgi:hypothetical protein
LSVTIFTAEKKKVAEISNLLLSGVRFLFSNESDRASVERQSGKGNRSEWNRIQHRMPITPIDCDPGCFARYGFVQTKFCASSGLPVPLYFATCG